MDVSAAAVLPGAGLKPYRSITEECSKLFGYNKFFCNPGKDGCYRNGA